MVELFWWWSGQRYISDEEIAEIKKNMKRVPLIQKKSEEIHNIDIEMAEKKLSDYEKIIQEWEEKIISTNNNNNNNLDKNTDKNRFKELIKNIKKKLRFD